MNEQINEWINKLIISEMNAQKWMDWVGGSMESELIELGSNERVSE